MSHRSGIAIIGMACRFPEAEDPAAFWRLLRAGRHAFRTPPRDRWDHDAFFSTSQRTMDRYYVPTGAFLQDVRSFPAMEFGIPPRRVEVMDPQQRLSLEAAVNALIDAGYEPGMAGPGMRGPLLRPFARRRTGVCMGLSVTEYRSLLAARAAVGMMATGDFGDAGAAAGAVLSDAVSRIVPSRPFSAPGALGNMSAACVAQELDLGGAAFTVDAACASALVAVDDAIRMLRAGQLDMAFAGGVYINLVPDHLIAFSRIGAISKSGLCRPFDAASDGFVQGEGVGMVLLKRVEDAIRDGDRIYAVIDGSACNNDGRGDGPMSPRYEGQVEVLRAAWADAGLDPARVGYIEAHGTGTAVGDRTELSALRAALTGAGRAAGAAPIPLGSSKANIGHTMSAAGIAGLLRAALSLHHRTVPPLAGWTTPHPDHGLDDGFFSVPTAPAAWDAARPHAVISSFGFGGTNGHVVLSAPGVHAIPVRASFTAAASAAAGRQGAPALPDPVAHLVCTGADSPALLLQHLRQLIEALPDALPAGASDPELLAAAAKHLNAQRRRPLRIAVTAGSILGLIQGWRAAIQQLEADPSLRGTIRRDVIIGDDAAPAPVAFLCPGQGSQRVGLLAAWRGIPAFADTLADADAAVADLLPRPLTDYLYAPDATEDALTDTAIAQPAMLAVGLAVAAVLQGFGVRPAVVLGHSLGEFTAAVLSGAISARDAIRFVAKRGLAMRALPGDHGAMAAVMASREEILSVLDGLPEESRAQVVLANYNHPSQSVLSGPTDEIDAVIARFQAIHVKARRIPVSHAFHAPILSPIRPEVDAAVAALSAAGAFADPVVPFASCIGPAPHAAADVAAIFARHATSPVDYVAGLAQCRQQGAQIYVQLCSGTTLTAFAKGSVPDARAILAASDEKPDSPETFAALLRLLGWLTVAGHPTDLSGLSADSAGLIRRATLPPPPRPAESWWGISQEPGRGPQLATRADASAASAAPAAPAAPAPSTPDPASGPPVSSPLSPPAVPPADPGLSSEEEINARVLRVVAKVSAFPVDALSPKQRLLEDLGFDSLMLTELSNKLIEGFPGFGGIPRSMMAQSPTVSDLVRQVQSPGADALPLSDASRPLQGWRPALLPAPLCGRLAARPARVLDAPTLDELRALTPQSVVVRLPGALIGDDPAVGAVTGFVKALAREWPDHKVTALQGSLEDAAREAAAIERDAEVVWSQQDGAAVRSVVGLAPVALSAPPDRLDGLRVLITGGTGWLGQRIARAVAARGGQVTILGSRTDPGDALAALGAAARYLRADLSDPATLADQIAAVSAALSADPAYAGRPPSLLIHAAGVLADGPAGSLGADAVRRAQTLKVDALRHLAAAFPRTPIIAIGSYAARFGNALQTEYAAANEAMAFLARQLSTPARLVQTQVWGPWESSDMVARVPLHLRRAMREDGVLFVEEQQGIAAHLSAWAIDAAIPGGAPGQIVLSEIVLGLDLPAARRVYVEDIPLDPAMGWLRDHALFGRPTVPMAMVVEWAAQYARLTGLAPAGPGAVQIRDLTLYEGVVVEQPVIVRLRLENERFSVHVVAPPAPGQPDQAAPKLAWTARILPGAPLPSGDDLPQIPDSSDPSPLSLADFYAKHTFHGPLLRGITAIGAVGEGHVTGTVRTGSADDWGVSVPWTLGPLAIDSALQLAAVWARLRRGRGGFPVRLASWQQRDVPPGTALRARLAFTSARADRFTGDLILETLDGQIVAVGRGVEGELRSDELQIPEEHFRFDLNPAWIDLSQRLEMAEATGVRSPYFKVIEGVARDTVRIQGREVLHFSGYNYVGLSGHPEVTRRVQQAVVDYGTSVSASRVASGERPIHHDLEQRIAAALGVEAALVFTAGHATNVTTIGHLFGPRDLILHDELIHDSIFQGMRLSGATRRPFPHEDSRALARLLEQLRPRFERVLIVVEGVYSMDGDICDLPAYVALKKKHKTFLMVDEAHSFGVIGKNGYGVTEHFGIPGTEIDIWMGTLSKSLSSCGGYIAGSQTLITLLKYTAPGFIFSAGLTPANTMAAIAALDIMAREPQHVKKLQDNCAFFYKECQALGIDNGPARGESAVVPVITGNSYHALLLSDALLNRGINVQPILYPAVADNAARLRFFLSSLHSFEQLGYTARVIHEELSRIRLEFPV